MSKSVNPSLCVPLTLTSTQPFPNSNQSSLAALPDSKWKTAAFHVNDNDGYDNCDVKLSYRYISRVNTFFFPSAVSKICSLKRICLCVNGL